MLHTIKIIPKEDFGTYDVEMDTVRLQNVENVQIDMQAGEIPRVKIGFLAKNIDVELPKADVEVDNLAKENCDDH